MKKLNLVIIELIVFFLIINILMFTISHNYLYPMEVRNCELILEAPYLTPTGDYSSCIKLIEYPFYNYWLAEIIYIPFVSLLITLILGLVIWEKKELDNFGRI